MRSAFPHFTSFSILAVAVALAGCSRIPGRPGPGPEVVRPSEVPICEDLVRSPDHN
jgi:cytochrome c oxidase cbb3-type subunit 3/ubiquinol-cytochrome c reductase cytochrome c subunit